MSDFYALTYDASVPDWPGELDFYRRMAAPVERAGLAIAALYGDFLGHALEDKSSEMIWVARKSGKGEHERAG